MAESDTSESDESSDDKPAISSNLDDHQTDVAVDAIEHHDSDEVLTAEDSKFAPPVQKWYRRLLAKKKLSIPMAVIIVVAILATIPFTRYKLAGLAWKQEVSFVVIDAQTHQPVSTAALEINGKGGVFAGSDGKTEADIKVGSATIIVTKRYYKTTTQTVFVSLRKPRVQTILLTATGRQVPVRVIDKITGLPVSGVVVEAAGTSSQTDKNGNATIVLPADKASISGNIAVLSTGYNPANITIKVSAQPGNANTFQLTPAGKIYFLSNLSGAIDVVKTNLDGTDRQTVLAGTGNEDPNNTVLLASRDWKYLALLTKRTTNPELDLIDTTNNDQLTNIDQGNVTFTPIGWSNDKFIYKVSRGTVSNWQPGQEVLENFDAPSKKLTVLDQTSATGTSDNDYVQQQFGSEYIVGSTIVYIKNWFASYNYTDMQQLLGDQATLNVINNDGTGQKVLKTFSLDPGTQSTEVYVTAQAYDPTDLYLQFSNGTSDVFYEYSGSQVEAAPSSITDSTFYQTNYPTYLLSPSGNQTFWTEPRDGKNTLLVGDANGKNSKQVATLSDYTAYGWYTDNYLLVQKNGSELYIMPTSGGTPLQLSDYYKPTQNFNGYGGGYGGL